MPTCSKSFCVDDGRRGVDDDEDTIGALLTGRGFDGIVVDDELAE